jgi:hypothetical protein
MLEKPMRGRNPATSPFTGALIMAALAVFTLSGCATSSGQSSISASTAPLIADGQRTRIYKARAFIFTASPSPALNEKRFKVEVDITIRGDVKSYKFKNDFGADPKANTVSQVAFSGQSAGFGIYDHAGGKLAEHTNGKVSGPAAVFEIKNQGGTTNIRWFFSSDSAVSIIETVSPDGRLAYSEVTMYTAQ